MAQRVRRSWIFAWAGFVIVSAVLAVARLEVRNPAAHWEPRRLPPATELWHLARSQFGDYDVVLLGVALPDSVGAGRLAGFERWIGEQPEVASHFGPTPLLELDDQPWARLILGRQLSELRDAVMRGNFTLVYASLRSPARSDDLTPEHAFLERLEADGVGALPAGSQLFVAGKPAADVALNALLQRDALSAAPRALAVMAVLVGLLLGRRVVGPLAAVVAATVGVAGGMALFGTPVSTATVVTFPLTAVVGLAYGIHVAAGLTRTGSLAATRREVGPPLRWAFITTAAGIITFALSSLAGLRAYAYTATAGLALGYLAALTLVPQMSNVAASVGRLERACQRVVVRMFIAAARRRRALTTLWAAIAVTGALGLLRLRVEPNNYFGFFPKGHPTVIAHQVLDSVFGGSLPMFVLAESPSGNAYQSPVVRERIHRFLGEARGDPRVGPGLAPLLGPLPQSLEGWFQGRDERYTRAVFGVPLLPTPSLRDLMAFLDSLAIEYSDPSVRLQVTGPLAAGLPLLESLVESQVKSLVGVLGAVTVALLIVVPGWRRATALLLPNLFPPLAVAAGMGYLGIPVDFGTVVVTSMVIGIALDDTLQVAAAVGNTSPARAVRRIAAPVTITSLAAVAGFASFALSPFPVTQRLGLLTALGLTVAWAADVTLAPLLLAQTGAAKASR